MCGMHVRYLTDHEWIPGLISHHFLPLHASWNSENSPVWGLGHKSFKSSLKRKTDNVWPNFCEALFTLLHEEVRYAFKLLSDSQPRGSSFHDIIVTMETTNSLESIQDCWGFGLNWWQVNVILINHKGPSWLLDYPWLRAWGSPGQVWFIYVHNYFLLLSKLVMAD